MAVIAFFLNCVARRRIRNPETRKDLRSAFSRGNLLRVVQKQLRVSTDIWKKMARAVVHT